MEPCVYIMIISSMCIQQVTLMHINMDSYAITRHKLLNIYTVFIDHCLSIAIVLLTRDDHSV